MNHIREYHGTSMPEKIHGEIQVSFIHLRKKLGILKNGDEGWGLE